MLKLIWFPISRMNKKEAQKIAREILTKEFQNIKIKKSEKGKPYIQGKDLKVSFTYTKFLGCIALSNEDVGIDIEYIDKDFPWRDLTWVLTEREKDIIFTLDKQKQRKAFFQIWTQKEAFLKLLGTGFEIPPEEIDTTTLKENFSVISRIFLYEKHLFAGSLITRSGMEDEKATPSV